MCKVEDSKLKSIKKNYQDKESFLLLTSFYNIIKSIIGA